MQKRKLELISRYRSLFNSDDGKRVLHDMMHHWGVLGDVFDPDPRVHAYNEGARSVVMRILRTINTDPEQLEKAMKGQLEEDYDFE